VSAGSSGKLSDGEVDGHVHFVWFASRWGGALLLVLRRSRVGECLGRTRDHGVFGFEAQTIGKGVFRAGCENSEFQKSELFRQFAD